MPTYTDNGIVLGSHNLSESDKIISIYTRENGLVKAIAKGAKKQKSKFKGKLEKITCSKFQFAKGRNLDIIAEIEHITSFPKLRKQLATLTYGFLFLEIVKNFAHEGEQDSFLIYDLLYSNLEKLNDQENSDLAAIKFILEFLSIHGLKPYFDHCVSCSANLGNEISTSSSQQNKPSFQHLTSTAQKFPYSFQLGGILCKNCLGINHINVEKEYIDILQEECEKTTDYGVFVDFKEQKSISNKFKCEKKEEHKYRQVLELLREQINVHAKNTINSFELLFSL